MKEKLKTLSAILSWIFMFAAFLMLAAALVQAVQHKDSNEPNYMFGYGLIRAISGSMEPYFTVNGVALIKEVDGMEDIAVNDVVTFRVYSNNGDVNNITHRIIDINENGIITTKGDNNQVADLYPLTIEHIDSKVIFVCNQTAWFIDKAELLVKNPAVASCFALSLLLFAYAVHLAFKIRRDEKPQREEHRADEDFQPAESEGYGKTASEQTLSAAEDTSDSKSQ